MSTPGAPALCPEVDPLWGQCGERVGHVLPHRPPGEDWTWEPLPGMPPLPAGTPDTVG